MILMTVMGLVTIFVLNLKKVASLDYISHPAVECPSRRSWKMLLERGTLVSDYSACCHCDLAGEKISACIALLHHFHQSGKKKDKTLTLNSTSQDYSLTPLCGTPLFCEFRAINVKAEPERILGSLLKRKTWFNVNDLNTGGDDAEIFIMDVQTRSVCVLETAC